MQHDFDDVHDLFDTPVEPLDLKTCSAVCSVFQQSTLKISQADGGIATVEAPRQSATKQR